MSVIMNYYRHMDRSKIQFDFLCFIPCRDSYEKEINGLGGQVFFISKPNASLRSLREIQAFLQAHGRDYSWFHNHEVYLSALLKPLATHYGISGFIVHSHATKYSDHKLAAVRNCILCMPIRFMKCYRFACSKAAGAFLFGKRAVCNGKIYILYNAIDTEKFHYDLEKRKRVRKELGIADGTFVIGHVGRFVPQKNQRFLLDVLKELISKHPQIQLMLVGDGPLRGKNESYSSLYCLKEKVLFLGRRTDISDILNAMDIFVLPSIFEGIGIALIEAQANGLRGIASDCIPSEVNITGKVDFLPLDVSAWVMTLEKYITNKDVNRGTTITEPFRKKHYEIQAEASGLEKFYEDTNTYVDL